VQSTEKSDVSGITGTTFIVNVPDMLTATEKTEEIAPSSTIAKTKGSFRDKPFSVFLVDDDVMFLRSLEHHLQHKLKHNIKISTFLTGEECLKNLDQKPDIVVLDYILNSDYPSAMNGVSLLLKIKQFNSGIITIMISGQDKLQVAIDTMKYGAYDYVIKNENAFLKVQNAIKNGIHNILLNRELKNYKRAMKIALAVVGAAFLAAIIIQLFFPKYFHLGE
jgi:two-component system OmpR family response regulator